MLSTYHFDLSHYPPETVFTFHKAGKVYPVKPHDETTRQKARQSQPLLAACPPERLTHFAADVPTVDGVVIQAVRTPVQVDGPRGPGTQTYNQLVTYGISLPGASPLIDNNALAAALMFMHNNLTNLDQTNSFSIPQFIYNNCILPNANDLVQALNNLILFGESWISDPYPVMVGGQHLTYPDYYYEKNPADPHNPIRQACTPGSSHAACQLAGQWVYSQRLNADALQPALSNCVGKAIRVSKNAALLQGQTWSVQEAVLSSNYNAQPVSGRPAATAPRAGDSGDVKWTLTNLSPGNGLEVNSFSVDMNVDTDSEGYLGQMQVICKNTWLRHLSAYVQFLKYEGQGTGRTLTPISLGSSSVATPNPNYPGPNPDDPGPQYFYSNKTWKGDFVNQPLVGNSGASVGHLGIDLGFLEPGEFKKLLGWLSPTSTICGVPVPNVPTTLTIDYIPTDADVVRIMWGGLGRGPYDQEVCALGISFTAMFELALPTILLMYNAATVDSEALTKSVWNHKGTMIGLAQTIVSVIMNTGLNAATMVQQDAEAIGKFLAETLLPDLLQTRCAYRAILLAQIGEGEVVEAIPFIDIASVIFNGVLTVAQLTQTIVEVLESPFVYTTDIARSFDLRLSIDPDADMHEFPPEAIGGNYRVIIAYSNNSTPAVFDYEMPATTWSTPLVVQFAGLPAGGNIQVSVFIYSPTGWQAGQGQSGWMEAKGGGIQPDPTTRDVAVTVSNNAPPLDRFTTYQFVEKTVFQNGARSWQGVNSVPPASQPSATQASENGLTELNGLTICQDAGMLGYTFQTNADQFTAQNISLLQNPQDAFAQQAGLSIIPGLAYQRKSPYDGTGLNFYLDTATADNPDTECHLRRLSLVWNSQTHRSEPPDMNPAPSLSWGRFPFPMDRVVAFGNYVAGISFDAVNHSKIYVVRVPEAGLPLDQAPKARLISGWGTRIGLISIPRAITFGMQGQILVLEMGAAVDGSPGAGPRIQAFSVEGSVINCFDPGGTGTKQAVMPLRCTPQTTFLDLAVEPLGYLYVLSYEGAGSAATDYNLDLYTPDGIWLARTNGFAAANIAVDIIRNVYTLNYEALDGAPSPEPSLSLWIPPVKAYTGNIFAISGTTITIKQTSSLLTVLTNANTSFMVNGQKGSLSQLSVGQTIRAYGCVDSQGRLSATQVFVPDHS